MNKINLIGLGSDYGDLTLKAFDIIKNSQKVVVRTNLTKSFSQIKKIKEDVVSLDYVYLKSKNFDTLNKNLAKEVINMSKDGEITYLVDGCAVEDRSVCEILKRHKNVNLIAGVSNMSKCLEKLNVSLSSCSLYTAYDLLKGESLSLPAVIYNIDNVHVASEIKLKLINEVGEDVKINVVSNEINKKIEVFKLDRLKIYDYSTSIYIPKISLIDKQRFDFSDLLEILRILRGENGCPWDKVQTPDSIKINLIEECYELIDAIESKDDDKIIEETGDVLLQTAFYILFGEEENAFTKKDVLSNLCQKLITRHTHVFGKDKASDADSALSNWNKNKGIEKGYQNDTEYLRSVPRCFPAVIYSQKVGGRASKCGFDFEDVREVFSKIYEEIEEVKSAVLKNDVKEIEKECGDLLFSAVNAVRKLNVDGEIALKLSADKFVDRFERLEKAVLKDGKQIKNLSARELDKYYNLTKNEN